MDIGVKQYLANIVDEINGLNIDGCDASIGNVYESYFIHVNFDKSKIGFIENATKEVDAIVDNHIFFNSLIAEDDNTFLKTYYCLKIDMGYMISENRKKGLEWILE